MQNLHHDKICSMIKEGLVYSSCFLTLLKTQKANLIPLFDLIKCAIEAPPFFKQPDERSSVQLIMANIKKVIKVQGSIFELFDH